MNRPSLKTAVSAVGSVALLGVLSLLVSGCHDGSSKKGIPIQPAPQVVAPQITAAPTSNVTTVPGTPRMVEILQEVVMDQNEALTTSMVQFLQNGANPTQIHVSGVTITVTGPTGSGATRTYTAKVTFLKPGTGGNYNFTVTATGSTGSATTGEFTVLLQHTPVITGFSLSPSSDTTSLTTTLTFTATDADSSVVRTVVWGDGQPDDTMVGDTIVHTYSSIGSYSPTGTAADPDGNSISTAATATVSSPPIVNPLTVNGVAPVGTDSVAPFTSVSVITKANNRKIKLRGINFMKYPANQLMATIDGVNYDVVVNSDTVLTVIGLPYTATAAPTTNLGLFAHAAGDPSTVLETATVNGPLTLNWEDLPLTRMVHSGEDGTTTNYGRLFAYEVDSTGAFSNAIDVAQGVLNGPRMYGGVSRITFTSGVYSPVLNGAAAEVRRVNTSTGNSNDSIALPGGNLHLPKGVATLHNGDATMLTEGPTAYSVWYVYGDMVTAPVGIGLTLATGSALNGFAAIHIDGQPHALVLSGGAIRKLYIINLGNSAITELDVDAGTGFIPEAMSVMPDPFSGGYRVDMAGVVGTGAEHRSVILRTGAAPALSSMIGLDGSTDPVRGVVTVWDAANSRHLMWVFTQNDPNYDSYDLNDVQGVAPNLSYAKVHSPTLGASRLPREVVRADGLGGLVVGYAGAIDAGAMLVKTDGSATVDLPLPVTSYTNIVVGDQVFAVETRFPFHAVLFHHAPASVTSAPTALPFGLTTSVLGQPGTGTH